MKQSLYVSTVPLTDYCALLPAANPNPGSQTIEMVQPSGLMCALITRGTCNKRVLACKERGCNIIGTCAALQHSS